MPWNPMTGTFDYPAPTPGTRGYGGTKPTKVGGVHRGGPGQATNYLAGSLLPQERGRERRAEGRANAYEQALYDPEGTANRYRDIYGEVGRALAAPAQRDFEQSYARTGANAASRFGGNVSSEELRQGYNASDLFTRNLTEALARLGGEQVQAGQRYTEQLGSAAGQSADERDRLAALILQGIGLNPARQKSNFGSTIGGFVGGAASKFIGG